MKNLEGYRDPTAGRAINMPPQKLEQITGPQKEKPVKKNPAVKKKIVYYATPAYTRK